MNGGFRAGVTTLFVHAHISNPSPTAIVIPVKIKKADDGRYGSLAVASIPKIADGYAGVQSFFLKIKKGILTATCFDERLQTKIETSFADGTSFWGVLFDPCNPAG